LITKKVDKNEQEATIINNNENEETSDKRIQVYLDSVPQGAYVFFEEGYFYITPVLLNLQLKEYKLKIERLRYYQEDLVIDVRQINKTGNKSIQVKLKRNPAFTEDYYLSDSIYLQSDGIGKESRRYIYNENAKLIRIDSYIRNSYDGYYNITLDNNGNILTEQYVDNSGETNSSIEHFEYNNKNQLIKSWLTGRENVKWDNEYFYKDGILERKVSQSNTGTFVFDFIVETTYGSIDSEYTKTVTEKYFYPTSTEEERKKDLENDNLPRTVYTYQ